MSDRRRVWRCHVCNDIHFGTSPPQVCPTCGAKNAFVLSDAGEASRILELAQDKRLWRCGQCPDLHLGAKPLSPCPSCSSAAKYGAAERRQGERAFQEEGGQLTTPEQVLATWQDFVSGNPRIALWEEAKSVRQLSEGVLENMASKGLRYCPCRIPTGDEVKDLKLICPCNFLAQSTWKEYGECWCGLFRKR